MFKIVRLLQPASAGIYHHLKFK